jgi:predicted GNAT superfamily acetyltransferase
VVQVEIPCNYQAIKAADQGLALEWRLATRLIFESYLTRGYVVSDFCRLPADRERAVYLMHKGEDEDVTGAD